MVTPGCEPITGFVSCYLLPKGAQHSPRTKPQWSGPADMPVPKPITGVTMASTEWPSWVPQTPRVHGLSVEADGVSEGN